MRKRKFTSGVIPSERDVRDYTIDKKASAVAYYPSNYQVLGSHNIKNQGVVNSCVAHATSSILEAHQTLIVGKNEKLSTNFIYGLQRSVCDTTGPGMHLRDGCKIALKYGDPKTTLCKGNTEVDEVYKIAEDALSKDEVANDAAKHKIKSYAKLNTTNDIKFALMNYGPVLASIMWYETNDVDTQTGRLSKGINPEGYHAIMIYGWNEEGWLCQNSWGTAWGKNGCFLLPFNYGIDECYSLVPEAIGDEELKKPARNILLDIIYDILNLLLNKLKER